MAIRRSAILVGPAVALVAVGLAGRASGAHPPTAPRPAPRSSAAGPAAAPVAARPAGVAPLAPPVAPPVSPTVAGPVDAPVAEAARPRAAAQRGAPAPEPEPGPVAGRSPQTWALIVGINAYPRGDHDLRTAAADVRDVDDAVAGYGVASDHRRVLLDRSATAANIRAAFGWLTARAGPDDTAVVFFAGHAAHVGGGRRAGRPEVAAIAADDVALPQSELGRLLAPLRARSVWLAMAACYGAEFDGLLAPGRRDASLLYQRVRRHEMPPGKVKLSAADPGPEDMITKLPQQLQDLILRSMNLQGRVLRLDTSIHAPVAERAPIGNPLVPQLNRLKAAFEQ